MTRIEHVHARQVLDSRGKPTVEVEVTCAGRHVGRAIVPSGASTGQFEACELRDGDANHYDGAGVLRAVSNVTDEIASAVLGLDAVDQKTFDRRLCELDGTPNKSRLGANAILGVSLETAYAGASAVGIPLVEHLHTLWRRCRRTRAAATGAKSGPVTIGRTAGLGRDMLLPLPMVNMISGGLHAGRNLDVQDILILPVGAESYSQALEWIVRVYRRLGRLLTDAGCEGYLIGDEGGFGPKLTDNEQALQFVVRAIEAAGLRPGDDVALGLDVASTHFFRDGKYHLTRNSLSPSAGGSSLSAAEMVDLLEQWCDRYPLISIEDGVADDDWNGWKLLTEKLGRRVQLIGDDLFVTNRERLQRGVDTGVANSVLIKVNQIGTLWETLETLALAIDAGYWPVVSARSGETEDATIADLVVATGAGQIKVGSIARSERLAKYNQLLRLEEQLADRAGYLGGRIFRQANLKSQISNPQ
ncbi:MAG: phosphopyruvate hydratase [Planctomycetales bacterium]|nr:phosphopyruvate hydratase [Planctomycetales bacterium]